MTTMPENVAIIFGRSFESILDFLIDARIILVNRAEKAKSTAADQIVAVETIDTYTGSIIASNGPTSSGRSSKGT